MPNLTMAQEGSHFVGDGVQLSWPIGGSRQVAPAPEEMSLRLRQRIAEGRIRITDEPANVPTYVKPYSTFKGRSSKLWPRQRVQPVEVATDVPSVQVAEAMVAEPEQAPSPVKRKTRRTTRGRRVQARRRSPA